MSHAQAGILQPVPSQARYLFFSLAQPQALRTALSRLAGIADGTRVVAMIGAGTVAALGAQVPGLHEMPDLSGPDAEVPATPTALCLWLRGEDRGDLVRLTHILEKFLAPAFHSDRVIEAFRHGHGRDLTGYEDGTENPEGEAAEAAALVQGAGPGRDGGSMAVVQQWTHDFDAFEKLGQPGQDHAIGRRHSDNEELDDAPDSAHVKRTAQESFEPVAFVLRRSMPWALAHKAGLMFVAFGHSFDAFEAQMRRMAGHEDGIVDALFTFTKPVNGAYFWCPPVVDGRLDLRAIGL
jgi:putative iron-dependent peroxidase